MGAGFSETLFSRYVNGSCSEAAPRTNEAGKVVLRPDSFATALRNKKDSIATIELLRMGWPSIPRINLCP